MFNSRYPSVLMVLLCVDILMFSRSRSMLLVTPPHFLIELSIVPGEDDCSQTRWTQCTPPRAGALRASIVAANDILISADALENLRRSEIGRGFSAAAFVEAGELPRLGILRVRELLPAGCICARFETNRLQ